MRWGYCRVSTEEQTQGLSVDDQVARLELAGIPRDQIVVEVGSATKDRQPALKELFKRAKAGEIKSIAATRQDRIQRSRVQAAALWELVDKHGVRFEFLDQPDIDPADPASCLNAQILGSFAQFETAQLGQRVKNVFNHKRAQGLFLGRAPWGYRNVAGRLQRDTEAWEIARKVITTYLETGSSTAARKVRHEATGKPWAVSAFGRWIVSEVLRGAVIYDTRSANPEIRWGMHEALLAPAEWDALQAIRKNNLTNSGANRGHVPPSLATGIFICGHCGSTLHVKRYTDRKDLVRCRQIRGMGCELGNRNSITLNDEAPALIDWAIARAAEEIAGATTPTELPEPVELTEMRQELTALEKLKSSRAQAAADELRNDILKLQGALHRDEQQRQQAVAIEMQRLAQENFELRTDAERRSIATRFGLKITIKNKELYGFTFERLGYSWGYGKQKKSTKQQDKEWSASVQRVDELVEGAAALLDGNADDSIVKELRQIKTGS